MGMEYVKNIICTLKNTTQMDLEEKVMKHQHESANIVCTKHEKEKVKMQATIEKLQEAFCDKESKLQDTKSQLVRERRMSEIMERQLKNARNLSEQLGRIINDREQEIRTLKNLLNKRQDTKNLSETAVQAAMLKASRQSDRRRSTSKDDFQASMRRVSFQGILSSQVMCKIFYLKENVVVLKSLVLIE
ncbi:hypothetical protein TNIN_173851 [Trichonephila inaurata madagascariensis]|uniref:Uncharacterized protein n=1 Tax=Trichonephila inaurata madagascariensis TaxID=2747483 RepID=A0A8X6YTN4_9ARAC|nr:hypothetical protein TNIN_173851 [Trichonephila inaurata madagascariensis]